MSKNVGLEGRLKRYAAKAALVSLAAVSTVLPLTGCSPNKTVTETVTATNPYTVTETYTQKETETVTLTIPSPAQTRTITDTVTKTIPSPIQTQTVTVTDPALTKTVTQTVGTYTQTETVTQPAQTITDTIYSTQTITDTIYSTQTITLPPATVTVTTPAPPATTTKTITDTYTKTLTQTITQTITQTNTQTVTDTYTKTVTPPVQISNLKQIIQQHQDTIIPGGTGTSGYEAKIGGSGVSVKDIFLTLAWKVTGHNLESADHFWSPLISPPKINILTPTEFETKLGDDKTLTAFSRGNDVFVKGGRPLYIILDELTHEGVGHFDNPNSDPQFDGYGTGNELDEVVAYASEDALMTLTVDEYGLTALTFANTASNAAYIRQTLTYWEGLNTYSSKGTLGLWLETFKNPEWNAELVEKGKLSSKTLWSIRTYLMDNCKTLIKNYWQNLGVTAAAKQRVIDTITARLVDYAVPQREFPTAFFSP